MAHLQNADRERATDHVASAHGNRSWVPLRGYTTLRLEAAALLVVLGHAFTAWERASLPVLSYIAIGLRKPFGRPGMM